MAEQEKAAEKDAKVKSLKPEGDPDGVTDADPDGEEAGKPEGDPDADPDGEGAGDPEGIRA